MIPKSAEPIAKVIREQVPRPKDLPISDTNNRGYLRWERQCWLCCPLGLLPNTYRSTPTKEQDFFSDPPGTTRQIQAFGCWWDRQTSPIKAVEAVWGKE